MIVTNEYAVIQAYNIKHEDPTSFSNLFKKSRIFSPNLKDIFFYKTTTTKKNA